MSQQENYTCEDWKNATKEEFDAAPQLVAELDELVATLNARCKEANIPLFIAYVSGYEGSGYSCNCSQILPIERTPAELLTMAYLGSQGLGGVYNMLEQLGAPSPLQQLLGGLSLGGLNDLDELDDEQLLGDEE